MNKKLQDMTLEELWELFPIFLTEHKPIWKEWYFGEVAELKALAERRESTYGFSKFL